MRIVDIMTTEVATVQRTDDLGEAAQVMEDANIHHLPVLDGGKLVGVCTERDILRYLASRPTGGTPATVGDAMVPSVETAHPDDALSSAAERMAALRIGCLPVMDATGTRLVGMLTVNDILAHHGDAAFSRRRHTVGDVMTASPRTAAPDDPLMEGVARLLENNIRHLPVVDSEHRVVGMISDRDIRDNVGDPTEYAREGHFDDLEAMAVADAMNSTPITTRRDTPLAAVVRYFVDEKIGAIPVVDDDEHLVGIVSYVDVLDPVPRL